MLDTQVCEYDRLLAVAKEAAIAGVDVVQLRDKAGQARDMIAFAEEFQTFLDQRSLNIPFILNDRVDAALAANCGAHLGQEDVPIEVARRILGHDATIGVSCQTLDQAILAQGQGADYIGFGSVFKTKTKPDRDPLNLQILEKVFQTIQIPVFAIGGITHQNAQLLSPRGIHRVAVCRAICEAKNISVAVTGLIKALNVHL